MFRITSKYLSSEAFRGGKLHRGIDFAMEEGHPLKAIKEGTIRIADYGNASSGKTVFIDTPDGQTLIYGHLSKFNVVNGQHVNVGELIGEAGSTGFSTGSHLHFGVKEGGQFIDPSPYVDSIQNMDNLTTVVTETTTRLELSTLMQHTFEKFSETLSEMALNFIQLFDTHTILTICHTVLSYLC